MTTTALDGLTSAALSPDGANVSFAFRVSRAFVVFNPSADGSLSPTGCVESADSPLPYSSVAALMSVEHPGQADGQSVYLAAWSNTR